MDNILEFLGDIIWIIIVVAGVMLFLQMSGTIDCISDVIARGLMDEYVISMGGL